MTVKVELLFWKLKIVCKFFKSSKGFVSFLSSVVWKSILLVVLSSSCALLVLDVFLPSKCHSGLNALNMLESKTHLCDVGSVYHIGGYFKPLLLSMSNLLYYFFFWNVSMRSFFYTNSVNMSSELDFYILVYFFMFFCNFFARIRQLYEKQQSCFFIMPTLSAVMGNVFLSYYNIRTNFPALVISIPNNVLYYFNFVSFDFFKESDGFSYVCLNTCPLILGVMSLESPSSFVYQFFISNVMFYYEEISFLILFYFIFFYKKYLNYVVGSGVYNMEDISLFLM